MKLSQKIQRHIDKKSFPSEATLYNWLNEAKALETALIGDGKELPTGRRRAKFSREPLPELDEAPVVAPPAQRPNSEQQLADAVLQLQNLVAANPVLSALLKQPQ